MQSFYDGMTLVGSLVIMVAIIVLTYYASRWYAGKTSKSFSGRYIKIVDRISINPGCSLLVIQAGDKFYLVSLGDKNIRLICELEGFEPGIPDSPETQASFGKLFQGFLNKAGDSKDNGADSEK